MQHGKRTLEIILRILSAALVSFCANAFFLMRRDPLLILAVIPALLLGNALPWYSARRFPNRRLHTVCHGTKCLGIFLFSLTVSVAFHTVQAFRRFPDDVSSWVFSALVCIFAESLIFWNGMISVYLSSVQLGIRIRVLGIVCGTIPILHFIVLFRIIRICSREVSEETRKYEVDCARKEERVCAVKYPILLVHGVFFRDTELLNYWGRIPAELEQNGARIYYGEHESASSVRSSGEQLARRIRQIVDETGCEKVNIIAHSKGGLDCRCAIAECGAAPYVASLTTINTPHRGCLFADYLLEKAPDALKKKVENTYNKALRKFGDQQPDFLAAVYDLTSKNCAEFDKAFPVPDAIRTRSVGSRLNHATGGKFPLNFSYALVKHFDGANDGLVGENSFRFGQEYTYLTVNGRRGISHADMIDLNRENIKGFDVREFYVGLVSDLKQSGL